ncbi:MAG: D-sedoheptulose 7-phosphate isomerase [Candidatus Omnitrophica bacterium]|nr:D-sedoheptulose 7-phosphate isomerase [Candidatus Omnitrophota bacterium]
MADLVREIINESIKTKEAVLNTMTKDIRAASDMIALSLKKGGKLILFGNGGSAADAQHIAAELVGRFKLERQALASIALTTNTSIMTSIANDYGYEEIFSRQMEGLATEKDVCIGITTSGNARNVITGILEARKMGVKTIALTGSGGGELSAIADLALIVPSDNTARIQEAHIIIGHIICELVEEKLFKQ